MKIGLLTGLAFALFKVVQARRPSPVLPEGPDPWERRGDGSAPKGPRLAPSATLESPTDMAAATTPEATTPAAPTTPATPASSPVAAVAAVSTPADNGSDAGATPAPPPVPAPARQAPSSPPAGATKATKAPAAKKAKKAPAAKKAVKKAARAKAAKAPAAKKAVKKAAKKAVKKVGKGRAAEKAPSGAGTAWVAPDGAVCPGTHPVKAKLTSRIFHLPGMAAYERTSPDRCYRDQASAEADGLRKSKR